MAGCVALLLAGAGRPDAGAILVSVDDDTADHIHAARAPFTITVESRGPGAILYQWRDYKGRALTDPAQAEPGRPTRVTAPVTTTGYLGLAIRPALQQQSLENSWPGEEREYGFALLPPPSATRTDDVPFGTVHTNVLDPYLRGWSKTTTWRTAKDRGWVDRMARSRQQGLTELPIIVGDEWQTDDRSPVSDQQLAELTERAARYFAADKSVTYWETGIEENLRGRYKLAYYWLNLERKAAALRSAAAKAGVSVRLVYQIAELRLDDVASFMRSPAAAYYDVLSLHPYDWPSFRPPEQWLPQFLSAVETLVKDQHPGMQIWMTEVGAPHQGNDPRGFFGYPEKRAAVQGLSRPEAASYLVKIHAIALSHGIGKVFWYNYQDRGQSRERAEDHFGLRDYAGYPKPAYVAYVTMLAQLGDGHFRRLLDVPGNLRLYEFGDGAVTTMIGWVHGGADVTLAAESLLERSGARRIAGLQDIMGAPVPDGISAIRFSGEPLYIALEYQAVPP